MNRTEHMRQDRDEIQRMLPIIRSLLERAPVQSNEKYGCGINGTMRRVIWLLSELYPTEPKIVPQAVRLDWTLCDDSESDGDVPLD